MVKYLGDLSRTLQANTVISLLQPSGDVMSLFDDVMLLAEGCADRLLPCCPGVPWQPWLTGRELWIPAPAASMVAGISRELRL